MTRPVDSDRWLHERPEPIVARAMADEARTERHRSLRTGDYDGVHPLTCDCRRCLREQYDEGDER